MITIFTMAYNEEVMLQFMIDHYRSRFPNCQIIIRDNQSTDRTVEIALSNNCEVLPYDTGGQIDDFKLRDLKNNCWKESKTDWVLVCDVDELLDINEEQLKNEAANFTIIKTQGYDMINMEDNFDLSSIKYGSKDNNYSKSVLFNKQYIKEINYYCGAHNCTPSGTVLYSDNIYNLYHYKFINQDYLINRFKLTAQRLSEANKKSGMGAYNSDPEEKTRKVFQDRRSVATKVL
jgi:glycosyltransferase involved in cell wall biosynthesis